MKEDEGPSPYALLLSEIREVLPTVLTEEEVAAFIEWLPSGLDLALLKPRERQVLEGRSGFQGKVLSELELSVRLNQSKVGIRHICTRALWKLRQAYRLHVQQVELKKKQREPHIVTKEEAMRIEIDVPEGQLLTVEWLDEQLAKLKFVLDPEGHPYINGYWGGSRSLKVLGGPCDFLEVSSLTGHQICVIAMNDIWTNDEYGGWAVAERVVFHFDGTAYVDPRMEATGEVLPTDSAFEDIPKDYAAVWGARTWAEGILALVTGLARLRAWWALEEREKVEVAMTALRSTRPDKKPYRRMEFTTEP